MKITIDIPEEELTKHVQSAIQQHLSNGFSYYKLEEELVKHAMKGIQTEIFSQTMLAITSVIETGRAEIIKTAVDKFKDDLPAMIAQGMGAILRSSIDSIMQGKK
jgi:spore coat polysaccharide biosynthesis protein SpsF (cytidylyltransferase family)